MPLPPIPDDAGSILTWLAAAAIVMLIHETGHGLAAVLRGGRLVTPVQERAAKLEAIVERAEGSKGGAWDTKSLARLDAARTTARDALIVAIAGPIASVVGGIALILMAISVPSSGSGENLLAAAGITSLAYSLIALIPGRRPGKLLESDGQQAFAAMRALRRLREVA